MALVRHIFILFFLTVNALVFSQRSQQEFGKNRVQYKKFEWKMITTKHFTIYYYGGGNSLAHNTARYAETDYEEITNTIGYLPPAKTTIILYNSISDHQQSNIGLENKNYAGGETNLIKSKIEIAFNGSQVDLQKQIRFKTTRLLVNLMMFGGNFKDMVQNSYLLNLPDWFVNGISGYIAEGWSTGMEDALRENIIEKNSNPGKMTGESATLVGQSIWHFVEQKYGASSISSILNLTRIVRNEEISISNSLGMSYTSFISEWKEFYIENMAEEIESQSEPDKKDRVRRFNRRDVRYNNIAFNPDSSLLAYSENYNGRINVYTYNLETEKRKLVYLGGYRVINQEVDYSIPLLAWKDKQTLGVFATKKGRPYLVTKNLVTGEKEKKKFVTFDAILAFDYSPVKDEIVMSASRDGQSDIFVYNYKTDRAKQITKDLYDDLDVVYVPNKDAIVFSSNRLGDSLNDLGKYYQIEDSYDLFRIDLENPELSIHRISSLPHNEFDPQFVKSGKLYSRLVFDRKSAIAEIDTSSNTGVQLTNFNRNIHHYGISNNGEVAYSIGTSGKEFIHVTDSFLYTKKLVPQVIVEESFLDTTDVVTTILNLKIDDFTFGSEIGKIERRKRLAQKPTLPKTIKIYGPGKYTGLFGADYVVSSLLFDPLRGTGGLLEIGMSEMFSDHRFSANVFALTDLKSSSFSAKYELLKYRNDYKIVYDKRSIFAISETALQRYTSNTFDFIFSHPFTPTARIEAGPIFVHTRFTDFQEIRKEDATASYTGGKVEFVFDNTLEHGLNMREGTRMKSSFSTYKNLTGSSANFSRVSVDARNYTRIFKDLVFASRGSYGAFLGAGKKSFLLGGMDNWLFSGSEFSGDDDPLKIENQFDNSDLLFLEYATNLRGFKYNKLYGSNFLLFNFELRLPVAKLLHKGPISSKFLRNLQGITFYDIGTAWNGVGPFSQNNSINTQVIATENNPFGATVINYRNPFLSGYGLGLRSILWGYYVKLDVAWGVENYVVQSPKIYFTFGHDF